MRNAWAVLVPLAIVLVACPMVMAQPKAGPPTVATPADPPANPGVDYLRKRLEQLTVHPHGRPTATFQLQETPVFRWKNDISGADGAVFVWLFGGRPVLLSKCHLNELQSSYIESHSPLTTDPIAMTFAGTTVWSPTGVPQPRAAMSHVDPPAEQKAARLAQMKSIARRYRLTSFWGQENASDWELRLLATPLYRYTSDEAKVIDGAIFGYAQGSNPEAVVVVEAVRGEDGPIYESFPARLTGYPVKAWRDDQQVLNVERAQATSSDAAFRHRYERLSPFPLPKTVR